MLTLAGLVQYHMWSLGVEEQVYLSWPAALLLLSSLGPAKRLISLAAMFFGSLLLCVFVMRGFPGMPILADAFADGASVAFYLTPFGVFEFIAGAAIGLVSRPRARWQSEASSAVGIATIVMAILAFNHDTPFPSYNALLPSLGAALVIHGGR